MPGTSLKLILLPMTDEEGGPAVAGPSPANRYDQPGVHRSSGKCQMAGEADNHDWQWDKGWRFK